MAARPFRILVLDGGGAKGAYTASVLATLEETTGRSCVDHFDLVAGTSTGGIIALALGLGVSARDICSFYVLNGKDVFVGSGMVGRTRLAARQLVRPKHDTTGLRDALVSVFQDRTLGDSRCRLVIPAYDVTESRIYVFKTAHHEKHRFDRHVAAVDIGLATAAAPTLFTSAAIRRDGTAGRDAAGARYVDGGVWANCPGMVALVEAVHFLDQDPHRVDILSIGTTSQPMVISARRSAGGLLLWGSVLVELLMTSQVQAVEAQAALLTNGGWHRINHMTGRGRFGFDKVEGSEELIELGRSDAVKRANLSLVEERFLNGKPASPFQPGSQADRA